MNPNLFFFVVGQLFFFNYSTDQVKKIWLEKPHKEATSVVCSNPGIQFSPETHENQEKDVSVKCKEIKDVYTIKMHNS